MNLLFEETKDAMIDSLTGLTYTYDSVTYDVPIYRSDEDIPTEDPIIVVSFLPTNRKIGLSLNNFLGKRDNPYYSDYGYGEYDHVTVRVFSSNISGYDGRAIAQKWMYEIESYIKNNWDSLITGGSVDKYSFGHSVISNPFVERQYGYEVSFDIVSTNWWTDEPATGAVSPVDVSGIQIVESGWRIWVSI